MTYRDYRIVFALRTADYLLFAIQMIVDDSQVIFPRSLRYEDILAECGTVGNAIAVGQDRNCGGATAP